MVLNLSQILILVGIIHGIVFCSLILTKKKYKSITNLYLTLTILSLVVSNLQYWLLDTQIISNLNYRIPTELLILPMFFLFVNSYLKLKLKVVSVFLILTPFIVSLICSVTNLYIPILSSYHEGLAFIFSLILLILALLKLIRYEKTNAQFSLQKTRLETKWLKKIIGLGFILTFIWGVEIYFMTTLKYFDLNIYYPLWISISILIYWIAYESLFYSNIYKERREIKNIGYPKKTNSSNSENLLFNKIEFFIKTEQNFLNPNLSLNILSKEFDKTPNYISQIFNQNSNTNFTDYVNVLRVNRAKEFLKNPDYNKYTIIAIGLECGFKSKSNFYNTFKKHTQLTPLQYKKSPES